MPHSKIFDLNPQCQSRDRIKHPTAETWRNRVPSVARECNPALALIRAMIALPASKPVGSAA